MKSFILEENDATSEDVAEAIEKGTDSKVILIDEKTFNRKLKKVPFSNKLFIVYSKNKSLKIQGAFTVSSVKETMKLLEHLGKKEEDVSLIGDEIMLILFDSYCETTELMRVEAQPFTARVKRELKKIRRKIKNEA